MPHASTTETIIAYRHDPYSPVASKATVSRSPTSSGEATPLPLMDDAPNNSTEGGETPCEISNEQPLLSPPEGTLHDALWDKVSFVPYPTEPFHLPGDAVLTVPPPGEELVRCFIGQLPYFVTDMQLSWLCYTFGNKNTVTYSERITKRQANGQRLPTGCIHAYCTRKAVEEMATLMHKKLIVDDTGVWIATTENQEAHLKRYVWAMKSDRSHRPHGRPYDSVVVQLSTSTYIPRHVTTTPALTTATQVSNTADVAQRFKSRQEALSYYDTHGNQNIDYHDYQQYQGYGQQSTGYVEYPYYA